MESVKKNYRMTLIINGVIAILFGVFALFVPAKTSVTIAGYFGLLILLGGLLSLLSSFRNMKKDQPYIYNMVISIIASVIGLLIFIYTKKSLEIFVIMIGIWAMIVGIFQIVVSIKTESQHKNKNILLFNGILSMIFGLILFFNPFETAVFLTFIAGILALILGIVLIYLAISFHKTESGINE